MMKVNAVKPKDTTHIEVSIAVHDELGDYGKKKESYGKIVERLLQTVKWYEENYGKVDLDLLQSNTGTMVQVQDG